MSESFLFKDFNFLKNINSYYFELLFNKVTFRSLNSVQMKKHKIDPYFLSQKSRIFAWGAGSTHAEAIHRSYHSEEINLIFLPKQSSFFVLLTLIVALIDERGTDGKSIRKVLRCWNTVI